MTMSMCACEYLLLARPLSSPSRLGLGRCRRGEDWAALSSAVVERPSSLRSSEHISLYSTANHTRLKMSSLMGLGAVQRLAPALARHPASCVAGPDARRWIALRAAAARKSDSRRNPRLGLRRTGAAPSAAPSFDQGYSSRTLPDSLPARGAPTSPGSLAFLPFLPSLTDLSSTLLAHPLVDPLTSLPSYGLTIIALTLFVRTCTTLPATVWARRRAIRFREEVKPEMREANERLAVEVMKECRKAGVGYEGYKNELRKRVGGACGVQGHWEADGQESPGHS